MKITNEEYLEYKNALEGHSMNAIWHVTPPECYGVELNFNQRKTSPSEMKRKASESDNARRQVHQTKD